MTMEILQERMGDILKELQGWLYKPSAKRKEVESLLGKLQFLAKCIKARRVFLARIIQWIRGMDSKNEHTIPREARKDIAWWGRCASKFNGVSLLWLHKEPQTDYILATDACLEGYGGIMQNQYIRGKFPKNLRGQNIAYLEILAVMIALKIWGPKLKGRYFWIHVDNEAVTTILNTGASRNTDLQNTLREIALIAAQYQFVIKARHISGISNRIPDWLSRWHEPEARKEFREFSKDSSLKHVRVSNSLFQFEHKW